MHWMQYGGWSTMGGMWLLWLIVIVVVVVAIYLLARVAGVGTGRGALPREGESAEEILRRRYARGEIDREQYERMMSDLRR